MPTMTMEPPVEGQAGTFSPEVEVEEIKVVDRPEVRSADEMKASYLRQYRSAAERGEVSFIKYWRLVREQDVATLARSVGVGPETIEALERPAGPAEAGRELLDRIARALRVPVEHLA